MKSKTKFEVGDAAAVGDNMTHLDLSVTEDVLPRMTPWCSTERLPRPLSWPTLSQQSIAMGALTRSS